MAYKILQQFKGSKRWEVEKFQTGGKSISDYKKALDKKKKLNNMSTSINYKVVKA